MYILCHITCNNKIKNKISMKKMKKFIILCRYECWGENGKEWTKWFIVDSKPRSLEDAEKRITELKANSAHTAKITKLNYEYTTRSL